jgi:hypothetical protein
VWTPAKFTQRILSGVDLVESISRLPATSTFTINTKGRKTLRMGSRSLTPGAAANAERTLTELCRGRETAAQLLGEQHRGIVRNFTVDAG